MSPGRQFQHVQPDQLLFELIAHHPVYMALGQDADSRQAAYRELFRHELDPGLVDEIRRATNGNFALGGSRFTASLAELPRQRAREVSGYKN